MPHVRIDCFVEALEAYPRDAWVVAVDVIRSTTTAITTVAAGRRCFVVGDLEEAARLHDRLPGSLLVGELGGNMPFGFDLNNSPAAMADLPRPERPAILLSSSGTRLMRTAAERHASTRVACMRNWAAEAEAIVRAAPETVAVVGAGTRGEFREEDQLCCAWIAARLVAAGYEAEAATMQIIDRWRGAAIEAIGEGRSAAYLRASGQLADLDYVLTHVADVDECFVVREAEVMRAADGGGGPASHG